MATFKIKTTGIVRAILPHHMYLMEVVDDGAMITARLSARMRIGLSREIVVGEILPIVRSPHDLTVGQIRVRNWESPRMED